MVIARAGVARARRARARRAMALGVFGSALGIPSSLALAGEPSVTSAAGTACTTASDCPLPGAPCELCSDGVPACPIVDCVAGQCQYRFPSCKDVCSAGLDWCPLNGRCVAPACLACCQFGSTCSTASDCGTACVTCGDGSTACLPGQCGTELAGQCFFPEPVCPAPKPVPAFPPWTVTAAAVAMGLLGAATQRRRPVV
jgi:hypothetical protein